MDVEPRLRAFAAVARESSFSRAAASLFISQPAVSKHVASLEAEVGTRLVVRGRPQTSLTPAGRVLADYVLRAEALLANARRALAAGADAETGTLSLAASGIPGTYLLPALVSRFHSRYPGVELDLRLATSKGSLDLVRAHEVELAVVGGLTVPPELESEQLVEDEVVLIGPLALGGRRLRPKELESLTWVTREEGSATRAAVEAARWQIGLRAVRTLELPSWEAVKLAVAGGAGIAAISRVGLSLELEAGTLVVLDVPRWRLTRTIAVVRARDVPLTPPAERFLGLLREAFRPKAEALPPNSNLPAQPTSLVGRERELDELTAAFRDSARLVTLTGPGGSGKTRVALETAARLVDDFPDGVFLVDLAPLGDAALVPPAIARTLGVVDERELAERLRDRRVLLVPDNFEHVLAAAPTIADLLRSTSGLAVLATSRAPLRLGGEREYAVTPMPQDDAVRLFVDRARAADPAFAEDGAVAEICARLDRLPLAIELAAARVATLPAPLLAELLERRLPLLVGGPRDAPARQQTLRAALEWSYDLLGEDARDLFAALAVFRGGWTLEAAETVCRASVDSLEELVAQSLVQREPDSARFGFLETIRELASERLEASGQADEMRERHARLVLELARHACSFARGPEEIAWFDRLEREHANVFAALEHAIARGDASLGLSIAAALEPFWTRRHHLAALRPIAALLELDAEPTAESRGRVLGIAGLLASEAGQLDRAERWLAESVTLAERAGDDEGAAWALKAVGRLALERGRLEDARAAFEQSLALFESLGLAVPIGGRLADLSMVARAQGDLAEARRLIERSLEIGRRVGDRFGESADLHSLGDIALDARDARGALARYREALEIAAGLDDPHVLAHCLAGAAAAATLGGAAAPGAALWAAVRRLACDAAVLIESQPLAAYERLLGPLAEAGEDGPAPDEAIELARMIELEGRGRR